MYRVAKRNGIFRLLFVVPGNYNFEMTQIPEIIPVIKKCVSTRNSRRRLGIR
jgi:hypothetical protein